MQKPGQGPPARLRVAAVQMKFRPTVAENVDAIVSMVAMAGRDRVDVILFPECAVTGYNCPFESIPQSEIGAGLLRISAAARSAACHVLVGSPTFRRNRRFNSMLVYDRRGRERFRYSKIHLTPRDERWFERGNSLAFFRLAGVLATSIICHERRYPELVRLPVMMGAQIVFHPNAGLDSLAVSKTKRRGRDGVIARAFENQVFYVFANSVGPQGDGFWSAGDSKIVAPDMTVLALANNRDESIITAELDLAKAGRKYAREATEQPAFLRGYWKKMLEACRRQIDRERRQTGGFNSRLKCRKRQA